MDNPILKQDMEDIYSRNIDWMLLDGKTVLLTGAYGMLASYIVYFISYLNKEKNIDVRLIALVRNKDKFNLKFQTTNDREDLSVIESDLTQPLQISEKIDYIIHAASLASPQYYRTRPVDVILPNTIGNYNLLKLAQEKNVKGYLLFSTGDIYGSIKQAGYFNEDAMGTVNTLDLHNCYAESKRMAETMCKAFYTQYQIPTKIARIFHTYAPTMDIKNDPRVFSSFVNDVVSGKNIQMKSDGSGKRCFCYITDAVAAYFTILFKGCSGEAYNVCNTSQYFSIVDLAEKIVDLCPEKGLRVIKVERKPNDPYTENIFMVDSAAIPDDGKLKKLGWNPFVDITDGFGRVIRYLQYETCTKEQKAT